MDSELTMELTVPIPNCRHAEIVYNSLKVDKEPKRNGITRDMILRDNVIQIKWTSNDAKNLRTSVRGFFDLLNLSLQTIEQFDIIDDHEDSSATGGKLLVKCNDYNKESDDYIYREMNDFENENYDYDDCEENGYDEVRNLPLRSLQVPGTKYEYLDHTADVQIHAWGDTLKEAFEQCVDGMFGYMTEIDKVEELSSQEIEAEGEDMMNLLYHLLDEFLYIFSAEPFFIARRVKIMEFDATNFKIKAIGYGETFDLDKHPQGTEVKAITYSNMQIYDEDDRHEVFVIIDI